MKDWELEVIESIVNKYTRLDIKHKTRSIDYVKARMIYYKLSQEVTILSISRIAKHIGFHHATFLHSIKNFEYDIMNDSTYRNVYYKCLSYLTKVIPEYKEEKKEEFKKMKELIEENQRLRLEIAMMQKEIREDEFEEKLLNIFREMDFSVKLDLIEKAKTILKVKQKLNESTTNVRRV